MHIIPHMPLSPDSQDRQPTAWERALLKRREQPQEVASLSSIESAQQKSASEIREALDMSAKIISGQSDQKQMVADALLLTDRHQEHNIAKIIVDIIIRLRSNPMDPVALGMLAAMRKRANELGFFLMNYPLELEIERLTSPEYVVAQSYGRHPDPQNRHHSSVIPAADCQCWVPPVNITSLDPSDYPDTDNGDFIWDRQLVEKMKAKPWLFGEVKDITSSVAMQRLRLAGAARSAAFSHIKNEINPQRGERPVRYMTAAVANVTGIILPDGTIVRLADVGGQAALKNEHSTAVHVYGESRYPTTQAYTLNDRTVTVKMPQDEADDEQDDEERLTYKILVDWITFVHQLEQDV